MHTIVYTVGCTVSSLPPLNLVMYVSYGIIHMFVKWVNLGVRQFIKYVNILEIKRNMLNAQVMFWPIKVLHTVSTENHVLFLRSNALHSFTKAAAEVFCSAFRHFTTHFSSEWLWDGLRKKSPQICLVLSISPIRSLILQGRAFNLDYVPTAPQTTECWNISTNNLPPLSCSI